MLKSPAQWLAIFTFTLCLPSIAFAGEEAKPSPSWSDIGFTALDGFGDVGEIALGGLFMATNAGIPVGLVVVGKGVADTAATAMNIAHLLKGEPRGASSALGQLGGFATKKMKIGRKTGEMIGDGLDAVASLIIVNKGMITIFSGGWDIYAKAYGYMRYAIATEFMKSGETLIHELPLADAKDSSSGNDAASAK